MVVVRSSGGLVTEPSVATATLAPGPREAGGAAGTQLRRVGSRRASPPRDVLERTEVCRVCPRPSGVHQVTVRRFPDEPEMNAHVRTGRWAGVLATPQRTAEMSTPKRPTSQRPRRRTFPG